jgi:hypothetical protein
MAHTHTVGECSARRSKWPDQANRWPSHGSRAALLVAAIGALFLWVAPKVRAQGVWEYDPYRVTTWVSIDPSIPISDQVRQELYREIDQQVDLVFGPTWIQQSTEAPGLLRVRMQRSLESIQYDDLMAGEMVIVVRKDHPEAKTIRTLDAVLEKIDQVAMVDSVQQQVLSELKRFEGVETWKKLAAKLAGKAKTLEELLQGVADGTHNAAMIPQVDAEGLKEYARPVFVRLPWQVDSLVRSMDKILMVVVQKKADLLECQIREFDCPMRKFGPRITLECSHWENLPRLIGYGASEAFCPVARIEQSDAKSVEMRVRAAGLIIAEEHPAKIYLGDVLIPLLRRNDRFGTPTLLQEVPWTYIAVTEGDAIRQRGAIFSGIRGALQGRQNKRTQRVALRVKPTHDRTQLELKLRGESQSPAMGLAVYQRSPGDTNLDMQGRSDWRGIFTIDPREPGVALYDAKKPEGTVADGASAAAAQPAAPSDQPASSVEGAPASPPAPASPAAPAEAPSAPAAAGETAAAASSSTTPPAAAAPVPSAAVAKEKVQLRAPLFLYYVRNGETVLARLPILVGLNEKEVAELPDDSRRLEAESFLRGLQGEIVDAVARRQMLAMRIQARVKEGKGEDARKLLDELKRVATYDRLAKTLESVQRKVLATDRPPIPFATQKRIDTMFDTTRQMMQKYLPDALILQMESLVEGVSAASAGT